MDGAGFRYYLAPGLIRLLRSGDDQSLCFHLTIRPINGEYGRRFLTLLDDRQKHCVRRVVEFMIAIAEAGYSGGPADWWREAYESYWATLPPVIETEKKQKHTFRKKQPRPWKW